MIILQYSLHWTIPEKRFKKIKNRMIVNSVLKCKRMLSVIIERIINFLLFPIRKILGKQNTIILQTYSKHRYGGNPKYLYEYLSRNTSYNVYWVTESSTIKKHLESKKLKYITTTNFFHKLYVSLTARVIIDSGSSYYKFLGLSGNNAYKINTMHGSGPKLTSPRYLDFNKTITVPKQLRMFDYVSFCTEHAALMVGKAQFLLPSEKMVILGAPKSDQFFKKEIAEEHYSKKNISKEIIPGYQHNNKIIYYAPTFRPYAYPEPITTLKDFNYGLLNEFLTKNHLYLIYSHHPHSSFSNKLEDSDRIIYFSFDEHPLLDNNQFMMEVDVLVGDYSTLSTDFCILRRPQIFIMTDYDKYRQDRGFVEEMRPLIPGPEVTTMTEFFSCLSKYTRDIDNYQNCYSSKIDYMLEKYMDPRLTNSCERFKCFIDELLS